MRIGIVLPSTPAYSETFFNSKIEGLQENGFEAILFVQHQNPGFKLCTVITSNKVYQNTMLQFIAFIVAFIKLVPHIKIVFKFIGLERNMKTSWFQVFKKIYLNAHILSRKVEWLHFGFATMALGKELVAKSISAKMAVSFRGFDINVYPLKHPNCYALLWKHVDKVQSISEYLIIKAYILGLEKSTAFEIIYPAINTNKFIGNEFVADPLEKIQLLTIARLNWIKGIDLAIETMKILKDKGLSFKYHIVGGGVIGEFERYKYQVVESGLENEVVFHGKQPHSSTLGLLKNCNIYIQPSKNEGFCNALLEAQFLEKLCIAFNVGGISENIIDTKTGWLVSKLNTESLALKIIEVVHLPESKKQEISENAKLRVAKHFTIQQQQQKFVEFYKLIV